MERYWVPSLIYSGREWTALGGGAMQGGYIKLDDGVVAF